MFTIKPERRKRATIVCFLKKILQSACADVFTRPSLLGFQANYASPVTEQWKCWDLLGQKFDWFQTVRNKCQQVPTLWWFHANGHNKSQHCWAQQCWVLLANNVVSVCMGLYACLGHSFPRVDYWHEQTEGLKDIGIPSRRPFSINSCIS